MKPARLFHGSRQDFRPAGGRLPYFFAEIAEAGTRGGSGNSASVYHLLQLRAGDPSLLGIGLLVNETHLLHRGRRT